MSELLLQTKNLKKKYKEQYAINGINLDVYKGDVYGLLGPNGAGKTTTLKIIGNMIYADEGNVFFKNENKKGSYGHNNRIGMVIEEPCFYKALSGRKNLEVFGALIGASKETINKSLDIVGLKDAQYKKVRNYSQGMKQRLAIARAFLNNPELIILDEPTNGLDPSGIKSIRELIKQISSMHGVTVILSTHLLQEVENICTKIGIISKGRMVVQENIQALKLNLEEKNMGLEDYFIEVTESEKKND